MGFNTNITICNDDVHDYERNPERFVQIIANCANGMRSDHQWGITVQRPDHADATQLIAVGQNSSTKLYTTYYVPPHHTDEGQLEILRKWANSLGYDLHKRAEMKR